MTTVFCIFDLFRRKCLHNSNWSINSSLNSIEIWLMTSWIKTIFIFNRSKSSKRTAVAKSSKLIEENQLNMSKKPILYMHPLSPPVRAVMLTGAELGIEFELKPVDLLALEHKKPEFLKVNLFIKKKSPIFIQNSKSSQENCRLI